MQDKSGSVVSGDGLGTNAGGDVIRPSSGTTYGPSGNVCNQTLLAFDRSTLALLSTAKAREFALVQLRFAQAVSEQAARAYAEMIKLLEVEVSA